MEQIRYEPAAAFDVLPPQQVKSLADRLDAIRNDVFTDTELLRLGALIPKDKQPLDAGFIDLPRQYLQHDSAGDESLLREIDAAAAMFRDELDRVVVLGIGGSYMGARALFEALNHPYHNELNRTERGDIPRISFEGHNLDNDRLQGLLQLLRVHYTDREDVAHRWGVIVISKSGGTIETAAAFRILRLALEDYYGPDSLESLRYVLPITGEQGKLRDFSKHRGYPYVFPVPDGVGGRFSIFTPVGLLPAAVLGLDIRMLLRGAADMTERFRTQPLGDNPVLDYVAVCHKMETELGLNIRVLSTWGSRLEAVGLWYDQLLSESLGKNELGATPITVVNTRDLHSRGQQHQEGRRDKLITNVIVESPRTESLELPTADNDSEDLNRFAGREIPSLLTAAIQGTNKAYHDVKRPTADIVLPKLDEYALGQLFQMLMLATVVEGRLIGVNPYGQPGVEAYKRNMMEILRD